MVAMLFLVKIRIRIHTVILNQKFFELDAWEKVPFGNFSERAGLAVPC